MFRFSDKNQFIIQSDEYPGMFISVDERNAHYREIVMPWLAKGNVIADFVPDPNAGAMKQKAQRRERMLDELLEGTKTLDEIRSEVKADASIRGKP